jgi:GDP-D-mannose dehydratase
MSSECALITGITGQDGSYPAEFPHVGLDGDGSQAQRVLGII